MENVEVESVEIEIEIRQIGTQRSILTLINHASKLNELHQTFEPTMFSKTSS